MRSRRWLIGSAVLAGLLVTGLGVGIGAKPQPSKAIRTVVLVRHADTNPMPGEQDPKLTDEGTLRAARLAEVLRDEPMGAVFVTRTARSFATGSPTADYNGIEPTVYAPTGYDDLRAKLVELPGGTSALVVAHSNTVPGIVKSLGGREMEELPEKDFGRLFVLVMSGETLVRMVELRY